MLIDTDVLIWLLRGSAKAARALDGIENRAISLVTYLELLQGARDKAEVRVIKAFLADLAFRTLPLTENIGHRGAIYMEEYGLAVAMSMADVLIAATAVEHNLPLLTGNTKHYAAVNELELRRFRP